MLGMKVNAHGQRGKIELINGEVDEYQRRTSAARSNKIQLDEELRIQREQLDGFNIALSKKYETTKRLQLALDAMQNERDLAARQLQDANSENEAKVVENKDLVVDIKQLKEEIRDKDRICLDTHMKVKLTYSDITDLRKKTADLTRNITDTEEKCTEFRNKIQRAYYLFSQGELDILKQRQVVSDLESSSLALNTCITNRTTEFELLKVKTHTIRGLLGMGDMAYRKQADELEALKARLAAEVQRKRGLMTRVHHRRALQLEQIRLQKSVLMASCKSRALEEELEKPVNVHRWRFLEGTNPELSQLLKMNVELRDRLTLRILTLARFRESLAELKRHAIVLDTHLTHSYHGNINEEFGFLGAILKQKNKQLVAIEGQVIDNEDFVTDGRNQVRTIRSLVREQKAGYYQVKLKTDEIRGSALAEKRKRRLEEERVEPDARFIGGGYAAAGVVKSQLNVPLVKQCHYSPIKRKTSMSSLAAPQIIHPTSSSLQAKRTPQGWNPGRSPLCPILPTVSNPP
jgi:chromosome segregation ATPase